MTDDDAKRYSAVLTYFFRRKGLRDQVVRDRVQEALAAVLEAEKKGTEVRDMEGYVIGIAKHLRAKAVEEEIAMRRNEEPEPNLLGVNPWTAEDREARIACLNLCLAQLSEADREVVIAGESSGSTREQLAARLGTTANNLNVRAHRIRQRRLRPCIEKCLTDGGKV